jgi:hypothetical protein
MPVKSLKWYEAEFLNACGLAILYGTTLSYAQFAASRGLEPEEYEQLLTHLQSHHICR